MQTQTTKEPQLVIYYSTPTTKPRTVILWVSRHSPLIAQIKALEAKFGAIEIHQLIGTIPSAEYVIRQAQHIGARVIVPVLPLSMIAHLIELAQKEGIIVLWAEMRQIGVFSSRKEAERVKLEKPEARTIVEYSGGTFRVFEFVGFKKIKAIKLELEEF